MSAPRDAPARADLLALDEDKLAALANRGLVKRAEKDLEADRGPVLTVESDGTVEARVDDVVTRLVPGRALRDTPCSCGAPKVCRHRVMAVLAYRRARVDDETAAPRAWSPGDFDDARVAALLGRFALARAERRRRAGFVADVVRGEVPTVELPTCTVRFLVPDAPSYARCDCEAGVKCEHVALAVWAFREADARDRDAPRLTVELGARTDASARALDAALELAMALVLDGAAGSGAALGARFARAQKPVRDAKLLWPLTLLEELEEALSRYGDRAATYRPEEIGARIVELFARARAAAGAGELPARAILGLDEPMETRLEHLRLVSLGVRVTREDAGERAAVRADVFLADPDTLAVLVLRKRFDGEPGAALARRSVLRGVALGTLARGQMVTKTARRRANRLLVLGQGAVGQTSVTPQLGEWDRLRAPLFVERYDELARTLGARAPAFVRPRLLAERVHAVPIHAVETVTYATGTQTVRAIVRDAEGGALTLELEHSMGAPRALDALVAALSGDVPPRFVSGEVRREADGLILTPLAVVTDRVIALDLEEPALAPLPRPGDPIERDPIHDALIDARAQLDLGAHHGLRHVSRAWREDLAAAAARLGRVGLDGCAERTRAVLTRLAAAQGGELDAERALVTAYVDASLRVRLALEAA